MKAEATPVDRRSHHSKRSQKKTWLVGSIVGGLILSFSSAWVWRRVGGVDQYFTVAFGISVIAVLAALVAWIAYAVSKRMSRLVARALSVAIFVGLQQIGLYIGKVLYVGDVKLAKQYCESLIPAIEDVRKKYGQYPRNLEKLIPKGRTIPRLINTSDERFYWATAKTYGFSFPNPHNLLEPGKLCYSNDRKEWYACPAE